MAIFTSLLLLVAIAVGAGTEWVSRNPPYSIDQAHAEHGEPDECQLIEGGQVCSWSTSSGRKWDKLILTFDDRGVLQSGGEKRL